MIFFADKVCLFTVFVNSGYKLQLEKSFEGKRSNFANVVIIIKSLTPH